MLTLQERKVIYDKYGAKDGKKHISRIEDYNFKLRKKKKRKVIILNKNQKFLKGLSQLKE